MHILVVGAGHMGGAILRRWLECGMRDFAVINPSPVDLPPDILQLSGPDALPQSASFECVLFGVKPDVLRRIAPAYRDRLRSEAMVVSMAAGVTRSEIAAMFEGARVVRIMPNLPVATGEGVVGVLGRKELSGPASLRLEALLAPLGLMIDVEDDKDLDAITAMAGSGTGFVLEIMRAYEAACTSCGLPAPLARQLTARVFAGAALLGEAAPESFARLRDQVTSPGGTTAAGRCVLERGEFLEARLVETLDAAMARAREMSTTRSAPPGSE
jgi:pyrroline-5-carboxylate reductase